MPIFPFYKFSPSGNTTLFLLDNVNANSSAYCRLALGKEGICAEQCGMADITSNSLQMGAGEFCANACRAFGALLAMQERASAEDEALYYNIKTSGSPDPVQLMVKGKSPTWEVAASFSIKNISMEKIDQNVLLVRLPGINHILYSDRWPEFSQIPTLAKKARQTFLPDDCPANGIVWWREKDGLMEILPHVEVPASGTSMLESSCGSASLALAFSLARTNPKKIFHIRQPYGDVLSIILENRQKATLTGEVRFCAKGEIFLQTL